MFYKFSQYRLITFHYTKCVFSQWSWDFLRDANGASHTYFATFLHSSLSLMPLGIVSPWELFNSNINSLHTSHWTLSEVQWEVNNSVCVCVCVLCVQIGVGSKTVSPPTSSIVALQLLHLLFTDSHQFFSAIKQFKFKMQCYREWKNNEGFFNPNILDCPNWLHQVNACGLSLYLATEHNSSPISIDQFQKGTRFLCCHLDHEFKREAIINITFTKCRILQRKKYIQYYFIVLIYC